MYIFWFAQAGSGLTSLSGPLSAVVVVVVVDIVVYCRCLCGATLPNVAESTACFMFYLFFLVPLFFINTCLSLFSETCTSPLAPTVLLLCRFFFIVSAYFPSFFPSLV